MERDIEATATGTRRVAAFPPARRAATVRQAAAALAAMPDPDASDAYRFALADELFRELASLGHAEDEQDEAVGAFFHAVECALEELFAEALERARRGLS